MVITMFSLSLSPPPPLSPLSAMPFPPSNSHLSPPAVNITMTNWDYDKRKVTVDRKPSSINVNPKYANSRARITKVGKNATFLASLTWDTLQWLE